MHYCANNIHNRQINRTTKKQQTMKKIGSIVILLAIIIYRLQMPLKNQIPRLTDQRAKQIIKNNNTLPCEHNSIEHCKFEEGDILIKREITQNTKLLESITKIYFTHTAIYIENNILLVQFGFTNNPMEENNIYCSQLAWLLMKKAGLNIPEPRKQYISPDYLVMVAHTHPNILSLKYASVW